MVNKYSNAIEKSRKKRSDYLVPVKRRLSNSSLKWFNGSIHSSTNAGCTGLRISFTSADGGLWLWPVVSGRASLSLRDIYLKWMKDSGHV